LNWERLSELRLK